MPTWTERLEGLLPDLYLLEDTRNDLRALLGILGPTLDDLTAKIAGLPSLASVDVCPPDFLTFLAGLVGVTYDPTLDPAPQRRDIREAIERYRRIGTLAGLRRDLLALGWQGEIIETHRQVLRLGTRGRLNRQKLPGQRYNLGIYGVTGVAPSDDAIHAVLERHHPAGTRRWTEE
ncbi:MAG: Phage tail protein (Tail_P2_I) [bacterium ADurb.Bin429]|nr:MAG: Phage tail protein (Tail_P2_I) [bacterium ADurb.Bin429]